ncbi:hypothetical protein E8E13_006920 [Curvularia kusanoi]|uniref:Heterokaryon incompatibility domain-containing protein n=1 Tax=Curvularia kusanoi TaxID=90978 RepID=A0A9P4W9Q2_CURKU|nr:hypothetical protein E8E13_006920 [Curvularia kusanoi]
MSQIYSKCWQVIVWLNDEHGQCTREAHAFGQPTRRVLSLARLLQNDYFTRLWIVQELLLAPSICVFTPGNTWLWWPTVVKTTHEVMTGRLLSAEESAAWSKVPVNTSNLVIMTSTGPSWFRFAAKAKNRTSSQDLLQVLTFSANTCHEPRDKVYGLMSLLRLERQLEVDYNKPIYDIFKEAVIELHSVVNYVSDQSYREWLKAVQRLGEDMGVNGTEIGDLFALLEFVNLILPPQRHTEAAKHTSLPKLVSVIGVCLVDSSGSKTHSHHTDTTLTKTYKFNIIHELSSYWIQGEERDSIIKQKRWDAVKQSIADIASLGDDGSSLSWYYYQDDQTFKYKILPDWDRIFSIPLFRLARIVRDYEDERTKDELSKKQAQPIIKETEKVQCKGAIQQLSKEANQRPVRHRRTHRAIHYLAYGWIGLVGSLLVAIVVLCYVANMATYLIPVTLVFGGYCMVARPKKLD